MGKRKNHYLDNKRFEKVIEGYLENPSDFEEELVSNLDILITNILKNFKSKNGSAFNYFTTVIVNNLKLMYTKNKKYVQKLQDYKEQINGPAVAFGGNPWTERALAPSGS